MINSAVPTERRGGRRTLPVWGFLVLVIVWLLVVKLVGTLTSGRADVSDGRLLTTHQLLWGLVIPLAAGVLVIYAAVTVLGWWHPVLRDPKPVRRWVWWVAAIFAVYIVLGINYRGLSDRGAGFAVMLVIAGLLVGFGEEGLFRGLGVTVLRDHGLSEGKVALWSSVIFGAAHVANLIGGDARALAQAVIVSFAGYFFYLIRRVSGGNLVNSVLHGFFDFTIISGTQIIPVGGKVYIAAGLAILVYLACGVLVFARRHSIEVAAPAA